MSASATASAPPAAPEIRGGDAWVMPHETGAPAWITSSAPQIRVLDQRGRAQAPAAASAASTSAQ